MQVKRHFEKSMHACEGETKHPMARYLMSVITGGRMVRSSQRGGAATPVTVSHSLAARSLKAHNGCQKRRRNSKL